MQKISYIVSGFILGLLPLVGAAILGLVAYNELRNIYGIILCSILGILALRVGFYIYKRVQIVGPLEVMSATNSSPELDHLEPTSSTDFQRRSPEEFANLVSKDEQLFKRGSMRIFGAWFGRPYKQKHRLTSATYSNTTLELTLTFSDNEKLIISKPNGIFEATSYFKILKADKIKLEWYPLGKEQTEDTLCFNSYYFSEGKLKAISSIKNTPFDLSLGDPALMIYGY